MRNIIIPLSFVVLLCGCTHSKEEVEDYTKIYNELDARYKSLEENYNKLVKEYKSLDTEVKCLKSGREPRYFILIRMKPPVKSTFFINFSLINSRVQGRKDV